MERLNHQAGLLLKKVTEEADRCAIQEPMSELKMLWDNLDEKIISRQVGAGKQPERRMDQTVPSFKILWFNFKNIAHSFSVMLQYNYT